MQPATATGNLAGLGWTGLDWAASFTLELWGKDELRGFIAGS